jgi:hypothetical protein
MSLRDWFTNEIRNAKPGSLVRLFTAMLVFLFSLVNSITSFAVTTETVVCIKDKLILATTHYNSYLGRKNNSLITNVLLILNFSMLDVLVILLSYVWIRRGKNWRPVLTLSLFYLHRAVCSHLFIIKPQDNMLWNYPGFPSFTMSYTNNGDYFYSGSIGLYFICIIELFQYGYRSISVLGGVAMFSHIILMITLRSQYFLALTCGFFAAHYFYLISNKYCHILDKIYKFDPSPDSPIKNLETVRSLKIIDCNM